MILNYSVFQMNPSAEPLQLDTYSFWIVLSGSGRLIAGDTQFDFISHDILELPFHREFQIISDEPLLIGLIELSDFLITNTRFKCASHVNTDLARHTFYTALDLQGTHHPSKNQLLTSVNEMILHTLLNTMKHNDPMPQQVHQVIEAINQHFTEVDFDLNPLIQETGYSKNHFRKLFTDSVGIPPLKYVQTRRLDYAQKMLKKNPKMSIRDAAMQSGFADAYYFSRLFTQEKGLSPSAFRESSL